MTQPSDQEPPDPWQYAPAPEFQEPGLLDTLPPPSPPLPRQFYPVRFSLGVLAWSVIVWSVVSAVIWPRNVEANAKEAAANEALNLLLMRVQGRYLIGIRDLAGGLLGGANHTDGGENQHTLYLQAKALNVGPIDQRLRFVVLAGELDSPGEALVTLDRLDEIIAKKEVSLTAEQAAQRSILRKVYGDYRRLHFEAPSITDSERQQLRKDLGWFGDLALAPAGQPTLRDQVVALAGGPAAANIDADCPNPEVRQLVLESTQRVAMAAVSAAVIALGLLFLGCCGLLLFVVLMFMGKLRGGLTCGTAPAGVYAETFALWMVFFSGLGLALKDIDFGQFRLLAGGLAMLFSLVVLVWPVLRGRPWRQVREDIGLTLGRRPKAEPAIGVGCYVLGYPMMFTGILVMLILMGAQHLLSGGQSPDDLVGPTTPAHPIVGPLARGDWGIRLQIFFLASMVAPLVEETMFRGILYRHLRELTREFSAAASIILSGLVSSFIFAAIHPQGLLAVPVLMALACGFVLAREWRGTLVPSMVVHGLNNGLVLLMSIAMLGD